MVRQPKNDDMVRNFLIVHFYFMSFHGKIVKPNRHGFWDIFQPLSSF